MDLFCETIWKFLTIPLGFFLLQVIFNKILITFLQTSKRGYIMRKGNYLPQIRKPLKNRVNIFPGDIIINGQLLVCLS
jgi:hypothetical protein